MDAGAGERAEARAGALCRTVGPLDGTVFGPASLAGRCTVSEALGACHVDKSYEVYKHRRTRTSRAEHCISARDAILRAAARRGWICATLQYLRGPRQFPSCSAAIILRTVPVKRGQGGKNKKRRFGIHPGDTKIRRETHTSQKSRQGRRPKKKQRVAKAAGAQAPDKPPPKKPPAPFSVCLFPLPSHPPPTTHHLFF